MGLGKPSDEFRNQIVAAIPGLRAFGMSLTGRFDLTDDLVQETLTKAWNHHQSFQPGTNLKAWLFTILRNEFYTHLRKRRFEVEDAGGTYSAAVAVSGGQETHIEMADLRAALAELSDDQREAIVLIGGSGFSYQEAAAICEVAVGTMKSRVSRARVRLAGLLGTEPIVADPPDTAGLLANDMGGPQVEPHRERNQTG